MTPDSRLEDTSPLVAWSGWNEAALEKLNPLVYAELHRPPRRHMRRERTSRSSQTTLPLHKAHLRMVDWKNVAWQSLARSFGVSTQLMRWVVLDITRFHGSAKQGSESRHTALNGVIPGGRQADVVPFEDGLIPPAEIDPIKKNVMALRFIGGRSRR